VTGRRIRVSVVGASGYAGGELLRLLLGHPFMEVAQATSRRFAGLPVDAIHPNLRGRTDLHFCRPDEVGDSDVLVLALPNGESMKTMAGWTAKAGRIIDLGADFRLDAAAWKDWYGGEHASPELLDRFVYGVPEINGAALREARWVAGPGCEAIVSLLALYPLVKAGILRAWPLIINAKMGSSQSGFAPSAASHHAERSGVVRSYKPTGHRHAAEIARFLGREAGAALEPMISATAVEMVRGILVTIHAFVGNPAIDEKDVWQAYRAAYAGRPFVRIVKQAQGLYRCPEPKILQGTNYCEIGFEREQRTDRLVLLGAIDNLVKGTAGNAVQCLNLMCGFPETAGLEFPGLHPV
jgi:LysW-gamma-L-alpha-aminoadipyl-6-phosphate/LysW-L-glutamyl-5-phosphate reductase